MRAEDDSAVPAESDPPARDDAEFKIIMPRASSADDVDDDDGRDRRSELSRDVDGLRDRVRIIGGEVLARRYDLADRDLKVLCDIAEELRNKLASLER